jgi:excisionase family DNA binding protein
MLPKERRYSPLEARIELGCSLSMVYKLLHEHKLRHLRLGRRVVIPESALVEFIQRNEVPVEPVAAEAR